MRNNAGILAIITVITAGILTSTIFTTNIYAVNVT